MDILAAKYLRAKTLGKSEAANPGTANAIRNYGWGIGVFTFLGDVFKGIAAALIGLWLCGGLPEFFQNGFASWTTSGNGAELGAYIGGIAAVLGHIWPGVPKVSRGKGSCNEFRCVPCNDAYVRAYSVLLSVL